VTEHPLTRLAQGAAATAAELAQALDPMRAAICPHVRWWTRDLTRAENITLLGPMSVLISSTSACLTGSPAPPPRRPVPARQQPVT
jgi:hypothetical protein